MLYPRTFTIIVGGLILLTTPSCGRHSPGSFWKKFHSRAIIHQQSDQGPWGGHRHIVWYHDVAHIFTPDDLLEFAAKHDWQVVDSIYLYTDTLYNATHPETGNYTENLMQEKVWPKLPQGRGILYTFSTPWIAVKPGNEEQTPENGFAWINQQGTQMAIFHFWGE